MIDLMTEDGELSCPFSEIGTQEFLKFLVHITTYLVTKMTQFTCACNF